MTVTELMIFPNTKAEDITLPDFKLHYQVIYSKSMVLAQTQTQRPMLKNTNKQILQK